jgi:transcriptional regulator with XRE-family HTH domain
MAVLRGRVQALMADRGWDQNELAEAAGKSQPWVSQVLNGKRGIPIGTLEALGRAFAMDPVDLLREPGPTAATLEGFSTVPFLKRKIAAGSPLLLEPTEDDWRLVFHSKMVRKYPGAICLNVGDHEESMVPTIMPKDTVLLNRDPDVRLRPKDGAIYAVNYAQLNGDSGAAVKRVEIWKRSLVVSSENPDKKRYPTLTVPVDGLDLMQALIGLVVWHGRYMTPRK